MAYKYIYATVFYLLNFVITLWH